LNFRPTTPRCILRTFTSGKLNNPERLRYDLKTPTILCQEEKSIKTT
jgi:hypothetical protein